MKKSQQQSCFLICFVQVKGSPLRNETMEKSNAGNWVMICQHRARWLGFLRLNIAGESGLNGKFGEKIVLEKVGKLFNFKVKIENKRVLL